MRILVACEESQAVTIELRRLGLIEGEVTQWMPLPEAPKEDAHD